jgi:hypothetical protein
LNPVAVGIRRKRKKLSINVNGQWCSAVVEQMTHDPEFKGSNPATIGTQEKSFIALAPDNQNQRETIFLN